MNYTFLITLLIALLIRTNTAMASSQREQKQAKALKAKRESRILFGKPGQGRKTRFTDRKKLKNKLACREKGEHNRLYE